ncbi:unnamed protein product [Sphagnum balticum]
MICAAWLHDVVEDTKLTLAFIQEIFGDSVARLVEQLTDISKPNDGNRQVRKRIDLMHTANASPQGKTIKLADLIDNTKSIVERCPGFAVVYMEEKEELLKVLKEGDSALWSIAFEQVAAYRRSKQATPNWQEASVLGTEQCVFESHPEYQVFVNGELAEWIEAVNLIAKVKLVTEPQQTAALRETILRSNECCNWLSAKAWDSKLFQKFALQKEFYHEARSKFGLTAQLVIRCISKVADSYTTAFKLHKQHVAEVKKKNKKLKKEGKEEKPLPEMKACEFKATSAIAYDQRILRWYIKEEYVTIWSLQGRLKISFLAGPRQKQLLQSQKGESDLILYRGDFYLAAGCSVDAPTPSDVSEFLGVDLGIKNIAVDSDGNTYSGSHVQNVRHRHRKLRSKLQKKGTTNTNHIISKQIVALAKGTGRGIVLEDLTGIRERVTVRRGKKKSEQKADLHSWACYQLRGFVSYKAEASGVPEEIVSPVNSSIECCECGCVDKRNRPTRDRFCCVRCQSEKPADFNAALVIRGRASVNRPFVAYRETSHGT